MDPHLPYIVLDPEPQVNKLDPEPQVNKMDPGDLSTFKKIKYIPIF